MRLLLSLSVACLGVSACTKQVVALDGRPCDDGACADGYVCNPKLSVCVPPVTLGCDGGGLCPDDVVTGDACDTPGSYIPCLGTELDCAASGCRDCLEDHTWSVCDCLEGFVEADGDESNGCECQPSGSESCDGVDNDCDGDVDEELGLGDPCGSGACSGGMMECDGAGGLRCSTEDGGSLDRMELEVCDGNDNDCDTTADDGFTCVRGSLAHCDAGDGPDSGNTECGLTCAWSSCTVRWQRRIKLTFGNGAHLENLVDFPVLVKLTPERFDYAQSSTGADLRFYDPDMTPLPYEVERWAPGGSSYIWVRVPQIDSGSVTDYIWLYYDNPQASFGESPQAVWDDGFAAVWHLDEDANGTGSPAIYVDSTANLNHADDEVTATGKQGQVGRGQEMTGNDRVLAAVDPSMVSDQEVTVELWVEEAAQRWTYSRVIALTAAAPEDDFQISLAFDATLDYTEFRSDGGDIRFHSIDGQTELPYWIERWNPAGSVVWVKVPQGTTAFFMTYGNPDATSQSDHTEVFFPGLWRTVWETTLADHPINETEMNTVFGALAFTARAGWDGVGYVDCSPQNCNPFEDDPDENYQKLYEGWFEADTDGCYRFAINGDDAVDLHIDGGDVFKSGFAGGSLVVGWYDGHGAEVTLTHHGDRNLTAGLHRFSFRHEEGTGSDSHRAYVGACDNTTPNFAIIPLTSFWGRKRADGVAASTLGGRFVLGYGAVVPGSYGVFVGGDKVLGALATAGLEAPIGASPGGADVGAWHHVAMTYDLTELRVFADGVLLDTLPHTDAIGAASNDFYMGLIFSNAFVPNARLDEVRLSTVARSPFWLAAQHLSMRDGFITYGPSQAAP